MKNLLRGIWQDRFKRFLTIGLVIFWILLLGMHAPSEVQEEGDVHFFYHPQCPHCQEQKPFNEALMERHGVDIVYHDTSNPAEAALLQQKAQELDIPLENLGVPFTIIGEQHFMGFDEEIAVKIEAAIEGSIVNGEMLAEEEFDSTITLPIFGEIDVLSYSLPVLAIILGLVDGFNPCAMWVLVYLISLIISIGDRRKVWLLVGSFVLASGILYFLFMTAWLNAFLFLGYLRPVTLAIGLAALGFGVVNIKSFIESKGPLVCDVSDAKSRRKTMDRIENIVKSPLTWTTVLGIIALAFVVNSIEFACSAALPAIFAQVLAISDVSTLQHYLYILLYVLFFMLDDLIIFGLAAFAVSTTFGDRYAKVCKLAGGILLVIIGLVLTFAPSLLQ